MSLSHATRLLCSSALLYLAYSTAEAAPCITPSAPDQQIASFKADPRSVLNEASSDREFLERRTRDIVGTVPALASEFVRLAKQAPPQQQMAIAAGLAQAALSCASIDEQSAQLIQQAVAGFEDTQFQAAFNAVAGDVATAAVAAAAAASSAGSVVATNPSQGGTNTGPTGAANTFRRTTIFSAAGPAFVGRGNTVDARTAAEPVSPVR